MFSTTCKQAATTLEHRPTPGRYSEIGTRPLTLSPAFFEAFPQVSERLTSSSVFGLTWATPYPEPVAVPELVFDEKRQVAIPRELEGADFDLQDSEFYRGIWAATIRPTAATGTIFITSIFPFIRDRDSDASDRDRD